MQHDRRAEFERERVEGRGEVRGANADLDRVADELRPEQRGAVDIVVLAQITNAFTAVAPRVAPDAPQHRDVRVCSAVATENCVELLRCAHDCFAVSRIEGDAAVVHEE